MNNQSSDDRELADLPVQTQRKVLREQLSEAKAAHREMLIKVEVAKLKNELSRYRKMIESGENEIKQIEQSETFYR